MDYRKMYGILCRAASDALDLLPETPENEVGRRLLQQALWEAEDVYLSQEAQDENRKERDPVPR